MLTNKSEVQFYEVAYPVTELLFKTVFSQGQLTNALFTTNINRKLNFSLEFKALRSLGKYQNSLSGSKHFRFTYNIILKNLVQKLLLIATIRKKRKWWFD